MITYENDGYVFSYRVAGVAIYDKKVLVHRSVIDDFWSLPGGRCEFLEISKDTLSREMKEEIGVEIKIIRPLYFVENFFNFEGKDYHEISIFYLMEFPPDSKIILVNKIIRTYTSTIYVYTFIFDILYNVIPNIIR